MCLFFNFSFHVIIFHCFLCPTFFRIVVLSTAVRFHKCTVEKCLRFYRIKMNLVSEEFFGIKNVPSNVIFNQKSFYVAKNYLQINKIIKRKKSDGESKQKWRSCETFQNRNTESAHFFTNEAEVANTGGKARQETERCLKMRNFNILAGICIESYNYLGARCGAWSCTSTPAFVWRTHLGICS